MRSEELFDALLESLTLCEVVYRTGRSEEELAALAALWREDLADELMPGDGPELIREAFARHRKTSPYYPTPANVIPLFVELRLPERRVARPEAATPASDPAARIERIRATIRARRAENLLH